MIPFFLSVQLLFLRPDAQVPAGGQVDIEHDIANWKVGQTFQLLFDAIGPEELENHKFGILYFDHMNATLLNAATRDAVDMQGVDILGVRPADILAWFKYSCGDKNMTVSYFVFHPIKELHRPPPEDPHTNIGTFFSEAAKSKKMPDIGEPKQITIPLPLGLRDAVLFDKMRKIYPIPQPEDGITGIVVHAKFTNYWGFKSAEVEYMRNYESYYSNRMPEIDEQILVPIWLPILVRETPEGWTRKKEYSQGEREYLLEQYRKLKSGDKER
jgi:hypothetical protein